jgi:hypothetical protein
VGWYSCDEEFPMTLQIGMIASDGWVLASDRRGTEQSNQPDGSVATLASDVRKIELQPRGVNVAYSCAGAGTIVRAAGIELVDRLMALNAPWINLSNEFMGISASHPALMYVPVGSNRLIVVCFGPEVGEAQMWNVDFMSGPLKYPDQVHHWTMAGDFHNAARLLPQLYYSKRSCDELMRLAAFTILYGHLFNPSGIGGLDIVIGRQKKAPRFLNDKELDTLRTEFDAFDQTLASSFSTSVPVVRHYRP